MYLPSLRCTPSPSPSPSKDDDIDENFIANFDPNVPLTLETQYQLAQDEERPLPPPVSERGVPRAVTMLLLTGGILLLGLLIWQFIKPKSPREPIAQSTPKESSSGTIKDEKPELLAKLGYSRDTCKIGHDVKFCNNITFSISRSGFGSASTVSSAKLHSKAKRQA
ncbi:hypothetical protein [Microcoleus sp. BROC3]|uniref:hypothetical protein n=1 Tax=Microcoleus sp. BROC3 TaxID=3055323 RepID=UPI002FD0D85B